jgi:branched-chain amino acid transport system permease protein
MFNFIGPSVGAVVFVALREVVKVRTDYWPLVLGVVLLTLVLAVPDGVVGFVADRARRAFAIRRAGGSA